ncbi:MAG: hypothetical protein RH860_15045 [Cytophagales bacterium]
MKKLLYACALVFFLPLMGLAQMEYESTGEKFAIHDLESKVDFQLFEKEGDTFLKVWINTHLNIGCIDTSEYIILYLDNGSDVDLKPIQKYCGKLSDNKKHSDYEMYYNIPAEGMEDLRTHKIKYLEIEAEHQTLERKAEDFQDISKDHFETYFTKNLTE